MKIFLAAGVLAAVVVARPLYLIATATPLHPQPQSAPSVTQADPSPRWSGAVDRALVEQGLLTLDEEIQTYVPQFPKKPWARTARTRRPSGSYTS